MALLWMGVSAFCFSVMAVFVKRLSPRYPHFELVFFRSLINFVLLLGIMILRRENLAPPGKPLLLFRGLCGFIAVTCMFYSIGKLPLPVASMVSWTSPLFVILFSWAILGERLARGSSIGIFCAFVGLALLLNPSSPNSPMGLAIGLFGAASAGLAYVAVRAATARVGVNVIVLYFVGLSTFLSAPFAFRDLRTPGDRDLLEFLLLGIAASIGQLTMTQAYRFAAAGIVSSMGLLTPAFAALMGWLVFSEVLEPMQWAGFAVLGVSIATLTLVSTRGVKLSKPAI